MQCQATTGAFATGWNRSLEGEGFTRFEEALTTEKQHFLLRHCCWTITDLRRWDKMRKWMKKIKWWDENVIIQFCGWAMKGILWSKMLIFDMSAVCDRVCEVWGEKSMGSQGVAKMRWGEEIHGAQKSSVKNFWDPENPEKRQSDAFTLDFQFEWLSVSNWSSCFNHHVS